MVSLKDGATDLAIVKMCSEYDIEDRLRLLMMMMTNKVIVCNQNRKIGHIAIIR